MSGTDEPYDILIIGGGGVGLFLACRLQQLGLRIKVIEQKTDRSKHSKSIGIHPPSLEYLKAMGLITPFLEQGLQVPKGLAIGDHGVIGELDFSSCPRPFQFVLTLPQYQTETILENHLVKNDSDSIQKGCTLIDFIQIEPFVQATIQDSNGHERTISARFMIGCDGKNSLVRKRLNIPFKGRAYPDTFVMGDFADTTNFGPAAAIYLLSSGLIESFPLPGNIRRWVMRTPEYMEQPEVDKLVQIIKKRTGFDVDVQTNTMLSSFGVQHYLAESFGNGRIGIAGDAAHIVSPFGGQGMNLGWMDAWHLAETLYSLKNHKFYDFPWKSFSARRRAAAWQAIKRAEFNMAMGREHHFPKTSEAFVKMLLQLPTKWILPRLFTMRWL